MKNMDKYAAKDFFVYGIDIGTAALPIASGEQGSGSFSVQADSDFLWQKAALTAVNDSAAQIQNPGLTVIVTDTASGRQLANIELPNLSLWGNAKLPFVLPQPKLFQANGNIQVTVTNITAAPFAETYATIYVSFIGTKLFLK